uniref:Predicted protein n=1 Tax=Hordeum vulgare subsp. vulgare TaxID=112509 RepID=F2E6S1_HORVV|nr:predicted protein [Hordeum vulgare subsp. vulgare]
MTKNFEKKDPSTSFIEIEELIHCQEVSKSDRQIMLNLILVQVSE